MPGRNPCCCRRAVRSRTRPRWDGEHCPSLGPSGNRHGAAVSPGRAAGWRPNAFSGPVGGQLGKSGRGFHHGERQFAVDKVIARCRAGHSQTWATSSTVFGAEFGCA